ncbi:MAG: hypothetical protein KIT69_11385 [Propionibacteriaceae bacterium]|nr:hypothetical protein [Propionibacteriaceae bacterium]
MRRGLIDQLWGMPVTNLALNTSFEATSGTVEVWRNYFTGNPGRRAAVNTGVGSYIGDGGNVTTTASGVDSDWSASGKESRITWTTRLNTNGNVGPTPMAGGNGARAINTRVTFTWKIQVSHESAAALAYSFNLADIPVLATGPLPAQFLPGVTYQCWATVDAAARAFTSADQMRINPRLPAVDGAWVAISEIDCYPGDYQPARHWGDGSYSPDPDLAPAWIGATDASEGVLRGALPYGMVDSWPERARRFRSSRWSASGSHSVRVVPITTISYAEIAGIPVIGGRPYTILGTIHLDAPLTGTLDGNSRRYQLTGAVGANPTLTHLQTAPNTAGDHPVRAQFVTETTGLINIRLYNGAALGGGDVWWDNVMLVDGIYLGPYGYGDMPGWRWNSAPNQSTSVGYPRPV